MREFPHAYTRRHHKSSCMCMQCIDAMLAFHPFISYHACSRRTLRPSLKPKDSDAVNVKQSCMLANCKLFSYRAGVRKPLALAVAAILCAAVAAVRWCPPHPSHRGYISILQQNFSLGNPSNTSSCQQLAAVAPHSGAIYRTGGLSKEGIGSFIQQLKLSAVAAIYLNKTLIIDQNMVSEHGYNVPQLINEAANYTSDRSEQCLITLDEEVAQNMCARMAGQQYNSALLQNSMPESNCTELKQHKDKYIPYERYNDCIQPWLQDTFRGMFWQRQFSFVLGDKNCLNVGIHIRFGDLHTINLRNLDGRSMQLAEVNFAIYKLQKVTGVCYNFYVFAKNASEELKAQFLFPHTFVDTSDDLYDIYVFTLMDIYIQGRSSFCVISSLIEPNKTIITNSPGNKYKFDYKQVSRVYHYKKDWQAYVADVKLLQPNVLRHQCNIIRAKIKPNYADVNSTFART